MGQQRAQIAFAVLLAARCFRRKFGKIFVAQERLKQSWKQLSLRGHLRVTIETLSAMREMPHQGIDHHIPRPGVEGEDIFELRACGNHRDIGNSADIQRDAPDSGVPIQQEIDEGHERRALSARGHVRGTEIADRGDPRARGDNRWLADLQRRSNPPSMERRWRSLVKNGLPVRTDHIDLRRSDTKFPTRRQRGIRKYFAEQKIELADFTVWSLAGLRRASRWLSALQEEMETRQSFREKRFAPPCAPGPRQFRPPTFPT